MSEIRERCEKVDCICQSDGPYRWNCSSLYGDVSVSERGRWEFEVIVGGDRQFYSRRISGTSRHSVTWRRDGKRFRTVLDENTVGLIANKAFREAGLSERCANAHLHRQECSHDIPEEEGTE